MPKRAAVSNYRVLFQSENEEWISEKSFEKESAAKRSVTLYLKRNPEHTAQVISEESAQQWMKEFIAEQEKTLGVEILDQDPGNIVTEPRTLINPDEYEIAEVINTLHPEKPIIAIPENVLHYIKHGATMTIVESWKRVAEKMYGAASVAAALKR